ncbi:hypothetical protein A3Q56_01820 [Intoshia linei]|uniref:Uncharacterized protein n=1 Tax=Intoshia linei TaxID=1819745 RepID=A0A177B9W3_9BILA|nr:hypothetical protein A3Q56_01820 [Intoshia linei]
MNEYFDELFKKNEQTLTLRNSNQLDTDDKNLLHPKSLVFKNKSFNDVSYRRKLVKNEKMFQSVKYTKSLSIYSNWTDFKSMNIISSDKSQVNDKSKSREYKNIQNLIYNRNPNIETFSVQKIPLKRQKQIDNDNYTSNFQPTNSKLTNNSDATTDTSKNIDLSHCTSQHLIYNIDMISDYDKNRFSASNIELSWERRRSFMTSQHGFVNLGDDFKDDHSINPKTANYHKSNNSIKEYQKSHETSQRPTKVINFSLIAMGDRGVGKKAILKQFLSSDDVALHSIGEEESMDDSEYMTLNVSLDDTMYKTKMSVNNSIECTDIEKKYDAYLFVYSINDYNTFEWIVDKIETMKEFSDENVVIVIGNKIDLERKREAKKIDGINLAITLNGKYIETSSLLNINCDKLLVGLLYQIKLYKNFNKTKRKKSKSKFKNLLACFNLQTDRKKCQNFKSL